MTIDEFINSQYRNHWLNLPKIKVYVRKSKRIIDGKIINFFDIASVEVSKTSQKKGVFTKFLQSLLIDYPEQNLYIESILNPILFDFLERYKFKIHNKENMYLIR